MFHSHSSLLDLPFYSHPQLFLSLFLPSPIDHQLLDLRTASSCCCIFRTVLDLAIRTLEDSLVDWPHKFRSQVRSPTPLWTSECPLIYLPSWRTSFPQSHLRPCLRKWIRDKASEGQLASARIYPSARAKSMSRSSYSKHGETGFGTITQTEVEQRETRIAQDVVYAVLPLRFALRDT